MLTSLNIDWNISRKKTWQVGRKLVTSGHWLLKPGPVRKSGITGTKSNRCGFASLRGICYAGFFRWCPWNASGACRKTWANLNNCGKSRIPSRLRFFTFCTFGLIQKYQKIKAYQKWLKTGERFGWKKRRLLHSSSAWDRCTKITCASPAIIAGVSSLFRAACFLNAIFGRPVLSKLLYWYC